MTSLDTKNITLTSYGSRVREYLAGTPRIMDPSLVEWLDAATEGMGAAKILELGSGGGRDALYLLSQGHHVLCTDGAPAFVTYLRRLGLEAEELNIIDDKIPYGYELIVANAVFLHLTRSQMDDVLGEISEVLTSFGRLAFSVKEGNGEEWSTAKLGADAPRYFCYWTEDKLYERVKAAGFQKVAVVRNVIDGTAWLQVLAVKENLW